MNSICLRNPKKDSNAREIEAFFISAQDWTHQLLYIPAVRRVALLSEEQSAELQASPYALDEWLSSMLHTSVDKLSTFCPKPDDFPAFCINLTDGCNLGCRYCYLSTSRAPAPFMRKEQIRSIVQAIVNKKVQSETFPILPVTFYGGGEPTLNEELFRYTVDYLKDYAGQHHIVPRMSMTTNASYSNPALSNFIIQNFANVTISIDGPEDIQNLQRPRADGNASFDRVMRNARQLHNSDCTVCFRATVTAQSLVHINRIVDFFAQEFPKCTVIVSPMLTVGHGSHTTLAPPAPEAYTSGIYAAYHRAGQLGIRLLTPETSHLNPRLFFCGAAQGNLLIISPDGLITSCSQVEEKSQFSTGKFLFEQEEICYCDNHSASMNVDQYAECADCFCKYTCCGGCPEIRINKSGDLHCELTRNITGDILYNYLKKEELYDKISTGRCSCFPGRK